MKDEEYQQIIEDFDMETLGLGDSTFDEENSPVLKTLIRELINEINSFTPKSFLECKVMFKSKKRIDFRYKGNIHNLDYAESFKFDTLFQIYVGLKVQLEVLKIDPKSFYLHSKPNTPEFREEQKQMLKNRLQGITIVSKSTSLEKNFMNWDKKILNDLLTGLINEFERIPYGQEVLDEFESIDENKHIDPSLKVCKNCYYRIKGTLICGLGQAPESLLYDCDAYSDFE